MPPMPYMDGTAASPADVHRPKQALLPTPRAPPRRAMPPPHCHTPVYPPRSQMNRPMPYMRMPPPPYHMGGVRNGPRPMRPISRPGARPERPSRRPSDAAASPACVVAVSNLNLAVRSEDLMQVFRYYNIRNSLITRRSVGLTSVFRRETGLRSFYPVNRTV